MNLIGIGPGDLRAFVAVARAEGFRRAALQLGISQPALTARIQRLERAVGLLLLSRTSRRVALTDAGARLLQRSEHAIEELESILQDLREEAELKRGRVAFGASPSIAATMLPPIIQRFMTAHPGIRIGMADELATPILEKLSSGVLEFGIIPSPKHRNEFDVCPLLSDELVLVAPKSMGIPINRPVRFAELIPYPFVTMSRPSAVWQTMSEAFQEHGHTFKPVFQATSAVALLGFVERGIGLTVLPAILADQHVLHASFRVNISDTHFRREMSLVSVRGRALSPASAALAALIRSEFRKLPYAVARVRASSRLR